MLLYTMYKYYIAYSSIKEKGAEDYSPAPLSCVFLCSTLSILDPNGAIQITLNHPLMSIG